ncbi:MAG: formate dehydrogenase accessory sulfurtransferase FdhD [Anaerolineaceae bacterium]|nr:formate dehydrogenase accessory sulfurtransferase FdhD [Anaerolineaceae bacterium]
MKASIQKIMVKQFQNGSILEKEENIVNEFTTVLFVNGALWASFSCTPNHLEELGAGFLFNKGILNKKEDILHLEQCQKGNGIDIWLNKQVRQPKFQHYSSDCINTEPTPSNIDILNFQKYSKKIYLSELQLNLQKFQDQQALYQKTRGIHASAIQIIENLFYLQIEDISRHTTLDKLAGSLLLESIPISPSIILTSGRVSLGMMRKAMNLKAAMVASFSSPTYPAIQLAEKAGITLIGYARKNQFKIYTHSERLIITK